MVSLDSSNTRLNTCKSYTAIVRIVDALSVRLRSYQKDASHLVETISNFTEHIKEHLDISRDCAILDTEPRYLKKAVQILEARRMLYAGLEDYLRLLGAKLAQNFLEGRENNERLIPSLIRLYKQAMAPIPITNFVMIDDMQNYCPPRLINCVLGDEQSTRHRMIWKEKMQKACSINRSLSDAEFVLSFTRLDFSEFHFLRDTMTLHPHNNY